MGRISGLVPSRFLTLLAHLESNIQACLPLKFTPEEYEKQDNQLVAALCLTLGLFAVELAGFLSGVSMFNSTQSLLCILSAWPASPCDIITTHSFHFCRPFGHKSLPYVAKRISLALFQLSLKLRYSSLSLG
ncbi:transmembrane protein 107 isoform X10 [Rattus norvegicus]|uniref:transmembrane protein 107 isoform X10 n=1 Tax=Rattus norvegicus TaxID=10116 RepID=UPI0003D08E62|nr:transmembrane protein 107 isoform X7 [Rattus norvegicus]|eukprot:XP_006246873.1 PREDICTED: transmembrane protein 107 isoform X6 [Rattus norvegicus]